jgi:hypothetical protein
MPIPLTAPEVLSREFLDVRAKILELAAALDRLDRAEGEVADDPRLARIREGLDALIKGNTEERAEQVQLVFSRPYDSQWQQTLKVKPR